ncbi:hypothetical protein Q9966_009847 [Columba livia]|nr:hypothetical protein Q9966_009847 [Columba livia]
MDLSEVWLSLRFLNIYPAIGLGCLACMPGFYKAFAGNVKCSKCPPHSLTYVEATSVCQCEKGYFRAEKDPPTMACTRPPSAPRNVIFNINETALMLEWSPPSDTGGRKDLTYSVICKKCGSDTSQCEICGGGIRFIPRHTGLINSSVTVLDFVSHVNYTFEIEATNGVSELSFSPKQFTAITVTTDQDAILRNSKLTVAIIPYNLNYTETESTYCMILQGQSVNVHTECDVTTNSLPASILLMASYPQGNTETASKKDSIDLEELPLSDLFRDEYQVLQSVDTDDTRNPGAVSNSAIIKVVDLQDILELGHYICLFSKVFLIECILQTKRHSTAVGYTEMDAFEMVSPSLIGMVRKDWASQNSIALSWQEPDFPHGAILDYEIKYYEKEHEQLSYSSTRSKAPSVIVTGLKPATKYIFHIRVRTAAGYSGYSQKFEFETGDETSDMAAEQGQILVIATAAVGGFTLLVILTLFFLITGRCQWYIKAKMKSEEKRRAHLQNGDLRFPGIKTYIDPDTYEDPSLAVHEFAKEIDPSRIRIERVIGAGSFPTIGVKSLSRFLRAGFLNSILASHPVSGGGSLPPSISSGRPVMIVVEYMENGSLDSFLRAVANNGPHRCFTIQDIEQVKVHHKISLVILSIEEGYRLPAPMGCPASLHQLMLHCWQKERNHRPKFGDIVNFLDKLIRNPSTLHTLVEDVLVMPDSPGEVPEYPLFVSVSDWLDSIKMGQYKNNFMAAGFTTLDMVSRMSIDDIRRIGVVLIGHQRRIVSSLQTLRLQMMHIQEKGFHV